MLEQPVTERRTHIETSIQAAVSMPRTIAFM
jgi:hypothetical protein